MNSSKRYPVLLEAAKDNSKACLKAGHYMALPITTPLHQQPASLGDTSSFLDARSSTATAHGPSPDAMIAMEAPVNGLASRLYNARSPTQG